MQAYILVRNFFSFLEFTGSRWKKPTLELTSCRVIAGHNLAKKDIFGASDPYLRIDLIDSREEVEDTVITKTKKRTLNPKVSINLLIVRYTHYVFVI